MTLSNEFKGNAAALEIMDAVTYQRHLEKLVTKGEGYGKTESVGGFLLQDIVVQTETITGEIETTKNVAVEKLYLVIDLSQYPLETTRGLIVQDMAKKWGKKVISERDLKSPDFNGPGLWTLKKGTFEGDYIKANESAQNSVFKPNPEAYRVCVDVAEDVKIPVQWSGGFKIEAGGALAIREKDVPAVVAALQSIKRGEKTAEEALLTKDKDGNTVSVFDIYGMEPDFLRGNDQGRKANYNAVPLKEETKALAASLTPSSGGRAGNKFTI
jgi:hypothetical protein